MSKNKQTSRISTQPVRFELTTPITGDKIKGQVPRMVNPPTPPPKKD